MGGSKKRRDDPLNVVALCHSHHEMVTLHECSDDILDLPGRGLTYVYFDLHGKVLIERVLGAAADGEVGSSTAERRFEVTLDPEVAGSTPASQPLSAAAPSAENKEESDEAGRNRARNQEGVSDGQGDRSAEATADATVVDTDHLAAVGLEHRPSSLTHEERVAIAQQIKDAEWGRQWIAGDTANAWIAELGESAEQYLSDFGYVQESLANILRVCAKIPPAYRNGNLRFSHHVVVAGENLEDVEMHLAECVEMQWSVAEFRRQRKGTKPRVKRRTLAEFRAAWTEWPALNRHFETFLDYLEEIDANSS